MIVNKEQLQAMIEKHRKIGAERADKLAEISFLTAGRETPHSIVYEDGFDNCFHILAPALLVALEALEYCADDDRLSVNVENEWDVKSAYEWKTIEAEEALAEINKMLDGKE